MKQILKYENGNYTFTTNNNTYNTANAFERVDARGTYYQWTKSSHGINYIVRRRELVDALNVQKTIEQAIENAPAAVIVYDNKTLGLDYCPALPLSARNYFNGKTRGYVVALVESENDYFNACNAVHKALKALK